MLSLERTDKAGTQRLVLRANSNYVRYTMTLERKEQGAMAFTPWLEVGLTKEGESFAAGGADGRPSPCIVTGGRRRDDRRLSGPVYPICCTGCRDEFNENPQKYLAKPAQAAARGAADQGPQPQAVAVRKFEDASREDARSQAQPATCPRRGRTSRRSGPRRHRRARPKAKASRTKLSRPRCHGVAARSEPGERGGRPRPR